jgi:hypothetical protein
MALTALYGAGSGALHAVTGPDHILSLGPAALGQPRRSFAIGLNWGIGHALGTLALSVPLLLASRFGALEFLARFGDRLSASALVFMGAWSLYALRGAGPAAAAREARNPFWIGVVHGIVGAGSLLLVLPVLVSGSLGRTLLFMFAFAAGSTLAMAALTSALSKVGKAVSKAALPRVQRVLSSLSIVFGTFWLAL